MPKRQYRIILTADFLHSANEPEEIRRSLFKSLRHQGFIETNFTITIARETKEGNKTKPKDKETTNIEPAPPHARLDKTPTRRGKMVVKKEKVRRPKRKQTKRKTK